MILSSVPESVGGVKTSFRRNIRPFVETKMPLSNQVSRITWGRMSLRQKYHAIDHQRILEHLFIQTQNYVTIGHRRVWKFNLLCTDRTTPRLAIPKTRSSYTERTEYLVPRRWSSAKMKIALRSINNNNNNNIFISYIKYTNITPPANSKANRGRWCVDGLRFITKVASAQYAHMRTVLYFETVTKCMNRAFREPVIHLLVNADRWDKHKKRAISFALAPTFAQ